MSKFIKRIKTRHFNRVAGKWEGIYFTVAGMNDFRFLRRVKLVRGVRKVGMIRNPKDTTANLRALAKDITSLADEIDAARGRSEKHLVPENYPTKPGRKRN